MQTPARLFVIVGPSGSGKTSICKRIVELRPHFKQCVTTTTRAMRSGEIPGVHYHFMTEAEFSACRAQGEFIETAQVHSSGDWYGTSKGALHGLLAQGGCTLLSVDLQGLFSIKALPTEALGNIQIVSIFIDVPRPWPETLTKRLRSRRGGISETDLAARLKTASWEMARASAADHRIVNDDLEEAVKKVLDITNRFSVDHG